MDEPHTLEMTQICGRGGGEVRHSCSRLVDTEHTHEASCVVQDSNVEPVVVDLEASRPPGPVTPGRPRSLPRFQRVDEIEQRRRNLSCQTSLIAI